MTLKQVIKYDNANALEATWVEVVEPARVIPASIDPETGAETPEQTIPAVENILRCHAYGEQQMDMLRADIGDEMTPEIEALIADVIANRPPAYDPMTQEAVRSEQGWEVRALTAEQVAANRQAAVSGLEAELDRYLDSVAQQYRFSDRTRLTLRAGYPNRWHDLAVAYGTWMDAVNALCEAAITDVLTGERELPTWAQLLAELPTFEAPA